MGAPSASANMPVVGAPFTSAIMPGEGAPSTSAIMPGVGAPSTSANMPGVGAGAGCLGAAAAAAGGLQPLPWGHEDDLDMDMEGGGHAGKERLHVGGSVCVGEEGLRWV